MRSFIAATVATTVFGRLNYHRLLDHSDDIEHDMKKGEELFFCSVAVGGLVLELCPDNPDDCNEEKLGGFIESQWDNFTTDEQTFWQDCGETFDYPKESCDNFIELLLGGKCQLTDTVNECFERYEDETK